MRTVFNNSELTHVWANQLQFSGRGSNMFFYGDSIYSYGYHYLLGKILIAPGGEKVFFINSNNYSRTTNKQKIQLTHSVVAENRFIIPFPSNRDLSVQDVKVICENLKLEVKNNLFDQLKARLATYHIKEAWANLNTANKLASLFNLPLISPEDFPEWRQATKKSLDNELRQKVNEENKEEREKQKRERLAQKEREKLEKWICHEYSGPLYNVPIHLRLTKDGEHIETTKGAKVPINEGLELYKRLNNGIQCRGEKIGGYTLTSSDSLTVKIGCHDIPWVNIDKFFAYYEGLMDIKLTVKDQVLSIA